MPLYPQFIETPDLSGVNTESKDGDKAPIERLPECPLPLEADEIVARLMVGQPFSMALQTAELNTIYTANSRSHGLGNLSQRPPGGGDVPPEELPPLMAIKERVMQTGMPEEVEGWFPPSDGIGPRYFGRMKFTPYLYPDGSTGILSRMLDQSFERRTQQNLLDLQVQLQEQLMSLRNTVHNLEAVMQIAEDFLFIQDQQLRFVWASNLMDGLKEADLIGKTDQEVFVGSNFGSYSYRIKRKVLDTGQPFESREWATMRDGSTRYYYLRLEAFKRLNGEVYLMGRMADMSQSKLAEMSMAGANTEMAQLNQRLQALYEQLDEKNREVELEVEQALQTQLAMLPKGVPMHDMFDLCADMQTCKRVGGDYYDYLKVDGVGIVVGLGDATGHGLRGGLVVSAVRSYFQIHAETMEPGKLLTIISKAIDEMGLPSLYMGLVLFRYDGVNFQLASAGMPPVVWYKASEDTVEVIEIRSMFLGSPLFTLFPQRNLLLGVGDVLVFMSDGFTEARNDGGSFMPQEIIVKTVHEAARISCKEVVTRMQNLQRQWTGKEGLDDDSTILALKYKGEPADGSAVVEKVADSQAVSKSVQSPGGPTLASDVE